MCIVVQEVTALHKRINITLPEDTIALLERISAKGERSRLIDRAIRLHAEELGKAALRNGLRQGYERRSARCRDRRSLVPHRRRSMGHGRGVARPKRGEVYIVCFDPTVGAEIRKTRPALIIQNDVGNRYSPITIVAGTHLEVRRRSVSN